MQIADIKNYAFALNVLRPFVRCVAVMALMITLLSGCYHDRSFRPVSSRTNTEEQSDSMRFFNRHHYSVNYNFVVKADSLILLKQQPEELINRMLTDTVKVYKHDRLVVAEIRMIPADSIDSVWVQVARDQDTFGWIRESSLLPSVVPDDPISQFISTFSDTHTLVFLIVISVISVAYLMRTMFKRNAKIVHFNDISSFYPTLFAIIVASSATFYSSIQLFAPETWRHFYFHPTLNPFVVPPLLAVFLVSVWAIIIVGLATLDTIRHSLPTGDAILYVCGLAGVCAVDYIVFSITTLYYIGYPLFAAYLFFALRMYSRHSGRTYICGNCGAIISEKGRCPVCGTMNE